jgi:hypothetical protein
MSLKNPVTRPGIDPGTVRLVAQRLNHYATPGQLGILSEFNMRVEQENTLHTNLIIPVSEQGEISYAFYKALVFTVLRFDANA